MLYSWLRAAPRWLLLATLVYAPWAYGCTRQAALWGMDALLAGVLLLWALGCLVARRPPRGSPMALWLPVALLLALGWWMVFNASAVHDPAHFVFVPLAAPVPSLPGSVDRALSLDWMWRATTLLGTSLFVAAEIAPHPGWLLRLWRTVGLAGGSLALLGLLHKATGAEMIFWQAPKPIAAERVATFFATYYYHANAAAFFDLALLPTVGLLIRALGRRDTRPAERALWICTTVTLLLAVLANTSKAGHILAAGLLVAAALGPARPLLRGLWRAGERRNLALGALLLAAVALAVAQAGNLGLVWQRWSGLPKQLAHEGRVQAFRAGLDAAAHVGACGFGPGTFPVIFPYFTAGFGDALYGAWPALHDDYLQTLMEWGWAGALLWSLVFFGGIVAPARNYRRHRAAWRPRERLLLPLLLGGLLVTALHAGFDFPLQVGSIQLYVAIFLGVCWGSLNWARQHCSGGL